MQPFTTLESVAAPLPIVNVDTDMIIPKQFLKTIKRTGLGVHLFDEMRYKQDKSEIPEFILNQAPFRQAKILVSDDNFGCGSSREHAPWALLDFGIRAVIAPSFADIFFNNCFKNGILPIKLPRQIVQEFLGALQAKPTSIRVDLPNQTVTLEGGKPVSFEIESFRKHCLINGLDDIGLTLAKQAAIGTFEAEQSKTQPWLYAV